MSSLKNVWIKLKNLQFKIIKKNAQNKQRRFFNHDEKLVQQVVAKNRLPKANQIKFISKYLSKIEKIVIRIASGILLITLASLLINVYWNSSEHTAKAGGSYTEGLIGSPRYINPLFASANDTDLDISSLIFSGLMKYDQNGLVSDLAESYEISEDQLQYSFKLKQNVYWHDGDKLDSEDVVFTFSRINTKESKSPLYFNFKGVTIEKIDEYTVKFILAQPFAPFLESLTVGIIPSHIWKDIPTENMTLAELNLKPIGCGPYSFDSLLKNKSGEIKSFKLVVNENYYEGPAYIEELEFKFFSSFDQAVEALNNKNIEGISYLPKEFRERVINNRNLNFNLLNLPQYTSIFFNYAEHPILKDSKVRKILSHATNKEKIVNDILNAEAQILHSPILPNTLGYTSDITLYPYNIDHAKSALKDAGWELAHYIIETEEEPTTTDETTDETTTDNEEVEAVIEDQPTAEPVEEYPFLVRKKGDRYLELKLTTVNQAESLSIAKELQKEWQQIGVKLNIVSFSPEEIKDVIKNRDYEMLLYGQIQGFDPDPFPFWHSKQTTYPGLNLTSLKSEKIDTILEEARKLSDSEARAINYGEFQKLIAEEIPAIFLFNPTYTYPQNKKIKGFSTSKIITPSNRFNDISSWYIKTKRSWK
jgi:peptide/nickel transport system substrate-binding protein